MPAEPTPPKPKRCKYCRAPATTYVWDVRGYVCDSDECSEHCDDEMRERDEDEREGGLGYMHRRGAS